MDGSMGEGASPAMWRVPVNMLKYEEQLATLRARVEEVEGDLADALQHAHHPECGSKRLPLGAASCRCPNVWHVLAQVEGERDLLLTRTETLEHDVARKARHAEWLSLVAQGLRAQYKQEQRLTAAYAAEDRKQHQELTRIREAAREAQDIGYEGVGDNCIEVSRDWFQVVEVALRLAAGEDTPG